MGKSKTTKQSASSTATNSVDAATQERADTLWNLGMNRFNQANPVYRAPLVAGLTPDQRSAFDLIRNSGGAGTEQLATGTSYATAAGAYNPSMVAARPAVGASTNPADLMGPAAGARDVSAKMFTDFDIMKYLNPYTENVVDASLSDIERARREAQAQIAGRQARGAAFGDSRSGVEASLTNREFANTAASTAAGLRSAGFTQAANLISGDANRQLSADQGNQGADVTTGVANLNAGTNARTTGAGLANQLAMFNAGQDLTGQIANQGAGLTANQQRLSAAGALENLGMSTQAQALNQANALGAAGQVAQQTNQAGLTANYQEWLRQQGWDDAQLQQLAGIFGTLPQQWTQRSNSRSTTTQPGSIAGDVLGAALPFVGPGLAAKVGLGAVKAAA